MHRALGVSLTALLFAAAAQAQDPAAAEAEAGEAAEPAGPASAEAGEAAEPAGPAAAGPAEVQRVLGAVGYDEQGRAGRIHVVVRGDTLWGISDAYLGTPWVWPSIWKDNQAIANPHRIYPGDRIWITPWEMRRVTAEEAARLLAGQPAAPAPEPEGVEPPPPTTVREEQVFHRESAEETVGLVSEEVLESAASVVSAVPPRVMLGSGDRVYVGLGREDTAPGHRFTIFRAREKVFDPDTGRVLGWHVDLLGWLEVVETADEASLAEIRLAGGEIHVGDRLMLREPPLLDVPIRPSPAGVEGRISFFPNSRTLMGSQDFVYLNRGVEDGLEVGSPLEVYRAGFRANEPARGETVRVPERVVARLLVLRAQPNSAVAVVRHTEEELAVGDRFRSSTR
jgi:hypothetical protein